MRIVVPWLSRWMRHDPPQPSAPLLSRADPAQLGALAPLAIVLVVAAVLCGALGYLLARHSDDQGDLARRQALVAAIEDYYQHAGSTKPLVDKRILHLLEQASGLKGLHFDAGPGGRARELQPLIENGRIVGWFSWDGQAPTTEAVTRLWPLLILGVLCLGSIVGLSLWHLRRSGRALTATRARVRTLATDSQTGLPNANAMHESLERALAKRQPLQVVSYLMIGLDRLDEIAITHGDSAADELLAIVAGRLRAALPEGTVLGSLGAGRFAAVLAGNESGLAAGAGHAVTTALAQPVRLRGDVIRIVSGIGFASAPEHGTQVRELVRRADLALEEAKRGRRGRTRAFEGMMEAAYYERQVLKRDLQRAVTARALTVDYQPIVAADGYRIVGVEALLRWQHHERGPIPPTMFIPLAEQLGLMDEVGEFVLQQALADGRDWESLYLAVNLSPLQLKDSERVDRIAALVRESGIDPRRLVLEITEGVLIDEPERIKASLEDLRALGIRIALDDFGAGYSSLAYLRQLPIDKLKIDKGFVEPLGRSPDAAVIIQAIVTLGRALSMSVLVEGVETEEQRVLLRLAGCDEMQGFLFGRPGPAKEIDQRLAAAQAASPSQSSAMTA